MVVSAVRRSLTVRLSPTVVQEVARRAQRCGLDVPRWVGQVIEAYLAGDRCAHGPARSSVPDGPRQEDDE